MSFIEELKRRNVFRVAAAYLVTAWVALQLADIVLESIDAPAWILQVIMLALALGFPLATGLRLGFRNDPRRAQERKRR